MPYLKSSVGRGANNFPVDVRATKTLMRGAKPYSEKNSETEAFWSTPVDGKADGDFFFAVDVFVHETKATDLTGFKNFPTAKHQIAPGSEEEAALETRAAMGRVETLSVANDQNKKSSSPVVQAWLDMVGHIFERTQNAELSIGALVKAAKDDEHRHQIGKLVLQAARACEINRDTLNSGVFDRGRFKSDYRAKDIGQAIVPAVNFFGFQIDGKSERSGRPSIVTGRGFDGFQPDTSSFNPQVIVIAPYVKYRSGNRPNTRDFLNFVGSTAQRYQDMARRRNAPVVVVGPEMLYAFIS